MTNRYLIDVILGKDSNVQYIAPDRHDMESHGRMVGQCFYIVGNVPAVNGVRTVTAGSLVFCWGITHWLSRLREYFL
ncbi:hypothetical protein CQ018_13875 [Arthrobacter sp. MYb227]|uniref:hypothetical protein n=1 Tax=Arthrobacter sp. MYb227 TaxID=1848601 RepID=UPI000D418FCB|nr:hypothetical protein [Arthrobacter sp. MYb227]PQZ91052.1 hypothetical protein CQ018_13875 [Arthrobacter sp. MYb227]